ncbi:hypothetical protein ACWIUA_00420 [Ursidibacter sp. B-7004-1]
MANLTEHSRKLRAKTALEHTKRSLAEGKTRQILLRMDTTLADEFDAVLSELGSSRPQAIKALCEFYRNHK